MIRAGSYFSAMSEQLEMLYLSAQEARLPFARPTISDITELVYQCATQTSIEHFLYAINIGFLSKLTIHYYQSYFIWTPTFEIAKFIFEQTNLVSLRKLLDQCCS
jgi:hypothetical protein